MKKLDKLFENISPEDVQVDSKGIIRINNPELSKQIADIKGGIDDLAESLNTGTCNNTACFAPGLDQLATRR